MVDDCSLDNIQDAIFREFGSLIGKKIFYYKNEKNMELSYTRNKGFELSKGKYVFFLDRDDKWEEDYVENSLVYLKDYHLIYSPSRTFIDENSKIIRVSKKKRDCSKKTHQPKPPMIKS